MTRQRLLALLNELLITHSPVGEEREIDAALAPYFERCCEEARVVGGETRVGKIAGRGAAPPVQVLAHKDEICSGSALYATERVPGETVLALEIGPVAEEYSVRNNGSPVIWYKDEMATYTKPLADRLLHLAESLGFGAQPAVYSRAGTDASVARQYGQAAQIACLGFPAENSHGYELACLAGIANLYHLLMAWLCGE